MNKIIYLDTNILLHYQPFDQINWPKIVNAKSVTIVFPPLTIRELNNHKELHPRPHIKKRAGEMIKRLFGLFSSGPKTELTKEILVYFEDRDPTIDFSAHQLNPSVQDDHLIASIIRVFPKSKKESQIVKVVVTKQTTTQKEILMHNITLAGLDSTYPSFDIQELMTQFEAVNDQRKAQGIRYKLPCLLAMILLAKLAGETKPSSIADWLKLRKEQFVTLFNLKHAQVPSLNTIRRTLSETIIAQELQKVVGHYLHDRYGGDASEQMVLDGKTMRGTIVKGEKTGVHLLSAYLPEGGVVQDQLEVASKENEITAAPRLLAKLNLKGKVVSGDAMFTQRKLSVQVTAQGGDYLWFVKDNQPTLLADVQQFFQPPRKAKGWHIPALEYHEATSLDKGHGRIEQRRIRVIYDETEFLNWPNAKLVFRLERKVTHIATGLTSLETAYGISSLGPEPTVAQQLLALARAHWCIENGLHYRRDVTLNEDATKMKSATQAEAVAVLNNFIVGLAQKLGFANLAYALRHFNAQLNARLAQLALSS